MRIQKLTLFSSDLPAQRHFYADTLGLPLPQQSENRVEFQVGTSVLSFAHRPEATPYHFAFNIPANQEAEALDWVRQRVEVLPFEGRELIDFSAWRARALYFYDPAGSVVEFIARRDLPNAAVQPFGASSLLEVSEIGLPSEGIEPIYHQLHEATGIEIYSGSFDRFCAVGDEHGLFICVDIRKKGTWFPTEDQIRYSDFELTALVKGRSFRFRLRQGILGIRH